MSLTMTEVAAREVGNYKSQVQAEPESFLCSRRGVALRLRVQTLIDGGGLTMGFLMGFAGHALHRQ